jgi:hypothetical protein
LEINKYIERNWCIKLVICQESLQDARATKNLKQVFQIIYRHELETKLSAPPPKKNMEERNSQNKRLAKKKGSCRISIVLWA